MAAKLVQQVQFFAFLEEEMNPFLADSKKILGFFKHSNARFIALLHIK